jgi:hypothetical protein
VTQHSSSKFGTSTYTTKRSRSKSDCANPVRALSRLRPIAVRAWGEWGPSINLSEPARCQESLRPGRQAHELPLASGNMSLSRFLVERHGRIAAVLFPVSVLAGFAYTMGTGNSPLADGKDWVQGAIRVPWIRSRVFSMSSLTPRFASPHRLRIYIASFTDGNYRLLFLGPRLDVLWWLVSQSALCSVISFCRQRENTWRRCVV